MERAHGPPYQCFTEMISKIQFCMSLWKKLGFSLVISAYVLKYSELDGSICSLKYQKDASDATKQYQVFKIFPCSRPRLRAQELLRQYRFFVATPLTPHWEKCVTSYCVCFKHIEVYVNCMCIYCAFSYYLTEELYINTTLALKSLQH